MMLWILGGCLTQNNDVSWAGNVYALFTTQLESNDQASLDILNMQGEVLLSANAPYDSSPSYREFTIPEANLGQEVQILVSGPELYPTLYVGTTPETSAIWFNGSLYGYGSMWTESFFLSLNTDISSPAQSEFVQLIGRPSLPSDWENARISLLEEDGTLRDIQRYRYDDTGFLIAIPSSEDALQIDLFTCTDIAPGAMILSVEHDDGRKVEIEYYAQGGTVINAAHLLFTPNE
jgi:hypothetical protein